MADYLSDEEQAERLKRWWDKNGTTLIVALVLSIGAIVGWRYYQDYAAGRVGTASAAFDAYLEARAADDPEVGEHLAVLDDDYTGSAYHVFSLFYRAADQAEEEDWEEALAYLDRAIDLADGQALEDLGRHRRAKVLYQLDRLDDSEATLAQIRSAGLAPQVAELSADIAVARGDIEAAKEAYRAAIEAARSGAGGELPGITLLELKLASLVESEQ